MGERCEAARASFRGVQLRLRGEGDVHVGGARRKMAREGGKGREAEKRKENPMSDEVWPGAPSVTGRAAVCEGAEVEQEEETHGDLGEVEEEGES